MTKKLLITMAAVAMLGSASMAQAEDHGTHNDMEAAAEAVSDAASDAVDAVTDAVAPADIVDTASSNPDFSTLVTALQAAELVDALKAEGPFTVFAPTNEAFAALPEGTLEDLLKPENKDKLVAVLQNHVVSGAVQSGDLVEGETPVTTLGGGAVAVTKTAEGAVTVGSANVVAADVSASNGVIHVIYAVLVP